MRREESHFEASAGRRLFRRAWLAEDPERVLLVAHGYAEHSGRYEAFGSWFAERGCAVHAFDHQGHGRSPGHRCHVERFDDYLDDLQSALDRVRAAHAGIPLSLVGHSMGGLMVARFLVERRPAISSAVLSAPALALAEGVSRLRRLAARTLRSFLPRLALGSGLDPQGLSRDPEVVRAYLDDPLIVRSMSVSLAAELLDAIGDTAARAREIEIPLLLLHGEEDPLCPIDGSRTFHAGLEAPGAVLRSYPRLRHELFNEPEREQVWLDLLEWLRALEPDAA